MTLRKDLENQEKLKLERRADGQLWAVSNGEERAVRSHRLFPVVRARPLRLALGHRERGVRLGGVARRPGAHLA